jgi:hypothetical protein
MPQQPASVRLAKKALAVYAREIGEDADDRETVMADFLVSMMALAENEGVDFDAVIESARSLSQSNF